MFFSQWRVPTVGYIMASRVECWSLRITTYRYHLYTQLLERGNTRNPLLWRHNGQDSISSHQPHDCLLNRLFGRRSKKTSKLRVTGLCAENSPGTGEFPAQRASYAENVSIWWRHHDCRLHAVMVCFLHYLFLISEAVFDQLTHSFSDEWENVLIHPGIIIKLKVWNRKKQKNIYIYTYSLLFIFLSLFLFLFLSLSSKSLISIISISLSI